MLESVMSTKLKSESWGTSIELQSGVRGRAQRKTEARKKEEKIKQCTSGY